MTGLVRKATLLTACGLLSAGAAMASVPSAANSTIPSNINLVGRVAAAVSTNHPITVVVRDLANNPVPNSSVVIDFTGCQDVQASNAQADLGVLVDCITHTVRGVTDVAGSVTMHVQGGAGAVGTGGEPGPVYAGGTPSGACAVITADGVNLGSVFVGAFDLDKGNGSPAGVGASALSEWLQDFGACAVAPFCARSDFNGDGAVGAADLSLQLVEFGSSADNDPLCP